MRSKDLFWGRLSSSVFWSSPPIVLYRSPPVLISVYVVQFYEKIGASLSTVAFFQAFARGLDVIRSLDELHHGLVQKQNGAQKAIFAYGMCPIRDLPYLADVSYSGNVARRHRLLVWLVVHCFFPLQHVH